MVDVGRDALPPRLSMGQPEAKGRAPIRFEKSREKNYSSRSGRTKFPVLLRSSPGPEIRAPSDPRTDPRTMTNTVVFKVAMMCTGCSGAVERVLGKMEGVQSFDVNLETQKVTVVGTVTMEEVVAAIAKTGKAVEPWSD